jgi:putative NADH-flavin reductase
MKVLVVGAAGKTGRLVVERALAAGHQVTGLVHTNDPKEEEKHPYPAGMDAVHGDVRNPSRLETAMEGHDAVIDTLGGKTPFKDTDLESSAARVVIEGMAKVGAKRLIVISVMGVGESKEQAGFFYEHMLMPVFLRGALKDKTAMEDELNHSGLEWVLVRPPMLSDSDATGSVKMVPEGETAHKITRGDLAQFLVDQLTNDTYLGQTVTIANS